MMGEELLRRDVEYLADALLGSAEEPEKAPPSSSSSSSSRPQETDESSESKEHSRDRSSRRMGSLTT